MTTKEATENSYLEVDKPTDDEESGNDRNLNIEVNDGETDVITAHASDIDSELSSNGRRGILG